MTPLQALLQDLTKYFMLLDKWRTDDPITAEQEIELSKLEKGIRETIKTALTPPTSDEVCEAISKHLKKDIQYEIDMNGFYFYYKQKTEYAYIVVSRSDRELFFHRALPPQLIALIGRFYEAQQYEPLAKKYGFKNITNQELCHGAQE